MGKNTIKNIVGNDANEPYPNPILAIGMKKSPAQAYSEFNRRFSAAYLFANAKNRLKLNSISYLLFRFCGK